MPIIKIFKEDKYSQISNELLNDASLSLRAKGLLCYLISKPTTWNVNVSHLYNVCKEGKDAIYSTINELIEAGYIVRIRIKDDKGKHIGVDYHVYEKPQREIPDVDIPNGEKPDNSNTDTSINKECSNGQQPNSNKKVEPSMIQRKTGFLAIIINWIIENPGKYPKLMFVEFAKYWVEPSMNKKKVKLRFEDQPYFDIGRRLATWCKNVKPDELQKHWEKEKELPTVNELFKKQILKLTDEKQSAGVPAQ